MYFIYIKNKAINVYTMLFFIKFAFESYVNDNEESSVEVIDFDRDGDDHTLIFQSVV